ncbi:MAG: bifunctional oligoribonuclease/PAP phosphatase NrnA [Candidatus Eisenbacteria sp.]|nr:bifunctional oligoribonuclease/PAP phosphatase NrnA [Candidatus Eisenbacteria bacterium]
MTCPVKAVTVLEAKEVARVLEDHDGFVILSHREPDGDSVGSQLALCSVLRRLGKRAWAVGEDPMPAIYRFLEGSVRLELPSAVSDPQVFVVVDASNIGRVGGLEALKSCAADILNIDHHGSNTGFGRWDYVDPEASACSEQVYWIVQELGVDLTDEEAACLYVGLLTDTGAFRFPNTTSRCMKIAADLVDRGFSAAEVARKVFWEKTLESTRLLGLALSTLEVRCNGQIAIMHVSREMSREARATSSDSDGFPLYTKVIAGVKVGLLFREQDDGGVRVSLRSDSGVNVEKVARVFGGGGHPTSAGCVSPGTLENAKKDVVGEVERLLEREVRQLGKGNGRDSGSR